MITLSGVYKTYPGGVAAVRNLSFTVEEGEFCVLIGPSGCGKSTTLRMINRLVPVTSGLISVEGEDINRHRPELLRRRIGYSIQTVGLFPHMTVEQNVGMVPRLLKWKKTRIDRRVEELLELVNLPPGTYRKKFPRHLSGGEAQRVGVARALGADPGILLMDEPFGAIDPVTRQALQTEFARIQKDLKKTILFVTHDIDEAIRLASRIVILREGTLIQDDTPESILTNPANRFVSGFIGADRALKRLARLPVAGHVKEALSIKEDTPISRARILVRENRYSWVVDRDGRLAGWLDASCLADEGKTAGDLMRKTEPSSSRIMADSTLKEALSRMIQQGMRSAPVVNTDGMLEGEIRLADILEA